MRVYKFLNKEFGLKSLAQRRLKIARLREMNDPFDLLPFDLSDRVHRMAASMTLADLERNTGFLCFSQSWKNPVMWSHYSAQHTGLCLGFDIADDIARPIDYSATRQAFPDIEGLDETQKLDAAQRMLYTKFSDWRYEHEARASIRLDSETAEEGLFFFNWTEGLRLVEVVVGMRSATCRRELENALRGYDHPVAFIKAGASHTSFEVEVDPAGVINHDDVTWFERSDRTPGNRSPI